jgi:GMP synthase-like glutamine amidotransferase
MRAIRELLSFQSGEPGIGELQFEEYDVRRKGELPGLGYDIYISSGGPGSPYEGEGKRWELDYFQWLDHLWNHNERQSAGSSNRKHALFICHSFQMMCRFFALGRVIERKSESFGVFPTHPTEAGKNDPMFEGLPDPFYSADFRRWQVVEPSAVMLEELDGDVLAIEKKRPRIPLERATMAIRISEDIAGVQFHPEADPAGMSLHFAKPERMKHVVKHHGEEKYYRIMRRLSDENFLKQTHDRVLPNFIRGAARIIRPGALVVASA